MLTTFKLVFGALIVTSSLLFFVSPLIVSCFLVMTCIVSYMIHRKYFQTIGDRNGRQNLHTTRALTSRSVAGFATASVKPNLNQRLIKNARRRIAPQNSISYDPNDSVINWNKWPKVNDNRRVFNEMNSYSSTSSQPQSQTSLSYQFTNYGSKDNSLSRISPLSQLGNIRRVKLTPIETTHQRLNLNSRGVAVKIGSIPVSMTSTLNRLSNLSQSRSTFATNERAISAMPAQSQVIEALKEKRKRTQRDAIESEDSYEESNKKAKRDVSNSAFNVPNGLLASSKSSTKRASVIPNITSPKRVRNNEILSSYSSMNSPNIEHNSKRKLSPNSAERIDVKTKRNISPDSSTVNILSENNNESITTMNDEMDYNIIKLSSEVKKCTEEEEVDQTNKISYGLPYHLHSMEDHERDKNKARNRLSRYLTAIQEATSPVKEDINSKAIEETEHLNVTPTSDVSLPSVPAPVIFTSSRVETSVITTTTLLNTPISSISTSSRSFMTPQVSVQNQVQSDTKVANNDYLNEESMSSSPTIISNENASKPPLFDIPITSSPLFSTDVKTTDNSKVSSQSQPFTFSQPLSSIKFGGLTNNTNLFSAASIPPSTTNVSSISLPNNSSSQQLQIPQFSTSAPLQSLQPLANIKTVSMPAFNANTNSMTTFPLMQPNANFLSTEAQPSNQLFSLGVSSSRRTAAPRRTRSRR